MTPITIVFGLLALTIAAIVAGAFLAGDGGAALAMIVSLLAWLCGGGIWAVWLA